jgi:hypothetical protein
MSAITGVPDYHKNILFIPKIIFFEIIALGLRYQFNQLQYIQNNGVGKFILLALFLFVRIIVNLQLL